MKNIQLKYVAEFLMVQEIRTFQSRINVIFDELTREYANDDDQFLLLELANMARERFNNYYPDEPFFESVFNHEKTFWELFYKYDDLEDEDFLKASQKLGQRRKEEEFIYSYM